MLDSFQPWRGWQLRGGVGCPGNLPGLSLATTRGQLVRAVLEGIAASVAALVTVIGDDTHAPPQLLRVDGGLTNSKVLMQAQADILQIPIEVFPSAHATALGAAALARASMDPTASLADALGPWAPAQRLRTAVVGRSRAGVHGQMACRRRSRCRGRRVTAEVYDVAVIGGGVVGCAVARELSGYRLSVALLEAKGDVGDGTSKANTAILHTGFDASPGTLESRLVPRGYELLSSYAAETGIPVERTGAVLVAWSDDELHALPGLRDKAVMNGYSRVRADRRRGRLLDDPHARPRRARWLDRS